VSTQSGQVFTNESDSNRPLRGEVVYICAYDIAHDMKRERLQKLLGQPIKEYSVGASRRSPKQWFFYRPDVVSLPGIEKVTHRGLVHISRAVKVFSIGAISIQVRVPFEVDKLQDLVSFYELRLGDKSLDEEIDYLAEEIRIELEPFCIRPASQLGKAETYTIFCVYDIPIRDESTGRAEDWLVANRRQIGALLSQEPDAARLSEQEIIESTERYLTYYNSDLVVVDWDAALVVSDPESLDEVLHVVELANVQLLELGAYDRVLDTSLERAYRDLDQKAVAMRREIRRHLREIRVDLARLSDELLNTTKFFGDWHLARIYQALFSRFHLSDWHNVITVKLKTLAELYQLLHQDWINFWMVVLEGTIVLLFVIDVLLLIVGLK
jgi:hypothetical protein